MCSRTEIKKYRTPNIDQFSFYLWTLHLFRIILHHWLYAEFVPECISVYWRISPQWKTHVPLFMNGSYKVFFCNYNFTLKDLKIYTPPPHTHTHTIHLHTHSHTLHNSTPTYTHTSHTPQTTTSTHTHLYTPAHTPAPMHTCTHTYTYTHLHTHLHTLLCTRKLFTAPRCSNAPRSVIPTDACMRWAARSNIAGDTRCEVSWPSSARWCSHDTDYI